MLSYIDLMPDVDHNWPNVDHNWPNVDQILAIIDQILPLLTIFMVQECPSAMVRACSAGTGWRGAATSMERGRRAVTASRHCTWLLSCHCIDDVRNNCEMTHFFFSLIREPLQEQKLMPLVFYFDTHIITQVTLNVRHTFFDKVRVLNKFIINTPF